MADVNIKVMIFQNFFVWVWLLCLMLISREGNFFFFLNWSKMYFQGSHQRQFWKGDTQVLDSSPIRATIFSLSGNGRLLRSEIAPSGKKVKSDMSSLLVPDLIFVKLNELTTNIDALDIYRSGFTSICVFVYICICICVCIMYNV